ncbi:ATM_1a_G0001580.mRNA.1.CDS.1 [Saccharomyces cerevisiae]|nr:ATM_1a_G0001580.mRNA.1.CDS.1 [Saccharomyces cerevisiae]CAI7038747.1 ATM_1a_G0001580.mRNA.1.CDS.1 [Saccharomyces cerevisiae]
MPVSDSGFDNSSKTMKDDTIPTEDYEEITKESEMGDATKITSKVDANVIEKKDTDSENNITIAQDDGKVSWLQRVVEFFEVKNDSTGLADHKPENPIRTFKDLQESLRSTYLYNTDLRPVEAKRRTWTWKQYIFFWISGSFNVNTWQISATGLQLGLNWWQTWICIWVGYTFVAFFLILGSKVGNNYHISFPISSRVSFGIYFSIWIVINRVVMACVWNSTLAYIGSQCVQLMLKAIFGTNLNTRIKDTIKNPNLTNFEFMCFMVFWVACLPFLWFPPDKLRHIFALKSAITPFAAFGFLIWTLCKAKGHLALGSLNDNGGAISKTVLAWSVIRAIMSALDNFSTLILNAPDFTRFGKTYKSSVYSQLIALPVCYAIISLIGILSVSAAYTLYGVNYWSPLDILNRYLDNYTSGNRAGVFLISFIFAFDQLGANLSGNSIPAGTDLTALLPKFINIRRGSYICALISLAICPWDLLSSSSKFTTALAAYAVFLSAIAGVISADYFIVRKGYVNIFHCYTDKPGSYYMYNKYGTNWRAVVAYIFGIAPNFAGFLGSVGVSVPIGAMKVYYLNYFVGYLIAALSYCILVYFYPIKGIPGDAKITDRKWLEEWVEVEEFGTEREAFEEYGGVSTGYEKIRYV